jgi:hypothetical protein
VGFDRNASDPRWAKLDATTVEQVRDSVYRTHPAQALLT